MRPSIRSRSIYPHLSSNLFTDTAHSFGWVNASYVYGLEILNAHQRRALGAITPFETYSRAVSMQPF